MVRFLGEDVFERGGGVKKSNGNREGGGGGGGGEGKRLHQRFSFALLLLINILVAIDLFFGISGFIIYLRA